MQADQLYDKHESDRSANKEFIKRKMVERKYFKPPTSQTLTHAEREHVQYLHNTDPVTWKPEVIAEQFKIEYEVAKKLVKSKWVRQEKIAKSTPWTNEVLPTVPNSYEDRSDQSKMAENLPGSKKSHNSHQTQESRRVPEFKRHQVHSKALNKHVTWQELQNEMGFPRKCEVSQQPVERHKYPSVDVEEEKGWTQSNKKSSKLAKNEDGPTMQVDEDGNQQDIHDNYNNYVPKVDCYL